MDTQKPLPSIPTPLAKNIRKAAKSARLRKSHSSTLLYSCILFFLLEIFMAFCAGITCGISNYKGEQSVTWSTLCMVPTSWDDWCLLAAFMAFPLVCFGIWIYMINDSRYSELPTFSKDEWEGGFWHRDDVEPVDLETVHGAATAKDQALDEKKTGWDGQSSGCPPNTSSDLLDFLQGDLLIATPGDIEKGLGVKNGGPGYEGHGRNPEFMEDYHGEYDEEYDEEYDDKYNDAYDGYYDDALTRGGDLRGRLLSVWCTDTTKNME
ncbi:MAG: hypothetical protein LQ350_002839 [Teloschistes chrysophthalmus]|nr:MAG: hypothetical protein LQ350_002839 [Niorma chrysophthalma]